MFVHLELGEFLISKGVDVNSDMLEAAADLERSEICKILLNNGASINITSEDKSFIGPCMFLVSLINSSPEIASLDFTEDHINIVGNRIKSKSPETIVVPKVDELRQLIRTQSEESLGEIDLR